MEAKILLVPECRFPNLFLTLLFLKKIHYNFFFFKLHLEDVSIQFEELEERGAIATKTIYNFFDTLLFFSFYNAMILKTCDVYEDFSLAMVRTVWLGMYVVENREGHVSLTKTFNFLQE